MIVLAIVAVLTALALPALQRSIVSARQIECANNMRQIGVALFSYASDHGGILPPAGAPWPPAFNQMWMYQIWTYAGYDLTNYSHPQNDIFLRVGATQKNIFRCPASRVQFVKYPTAAEVNINQTSYGLNATPVGESTAGYQTPIPLTRILSPARAVMVSEASYCLGSYYAYFHYYGSIPHGGGANFLYFDGHAEWLPMSGIKAEAHDPNIFWDGR